MCENHAVPEFSRRAFAGLAAGAAGLALMPLRAKAAGNVEAMGITCIDYRLVEAAVRFFDGLGLTKNYDDLALAGASLAAVSPKFPSSNRAFWDQLAIAKELHHIRRVIVLDHRDCGAYKAAFGDKFVGEPPAAEAAQHKTVMEAAKTALIQMHPDLEAEFYLMALDGKAERLL